MLYLLKFDELSCIIIVYYTKERLEVHCEFLRKTAAQRMLFRAFGKPALLRAVGRDCVSGMNQKNFNREKAVLFDALCSDHGIQYIVDTASDLLGNPIVVADIANTVLAKTKGFTFPDILEPNDSDRDQTMLSQALFQSSQRNRLPQRFRANAQQPLLDCTEDGKCSCLCLIVVRSTIVGHLAVCQEKTPLTEAIFPLVTMLAQVLALELQKGTQNFMAGFASSRLFLLDLLEKRLTSPAGIQQRLEQLKWQPKSDFCLAIIQNPTVQPTPFLLQSTIDYLRLLFPNSLAALDETGIVLLLTMERNAGLEQFDLAMLEEFLISCDQSCGFSQIFYELTDVADAYQQARSVLEVAQKMGWPTKSVQYADCYVFSLLETFGRHFNPKSLCMPTMLLLREYDQTHNVPLTPTLRAFLAHSLDYGKTAEALFIHRNSLTYRLDKIKSILCIPSFSGKDVLHIQLTLRVFDYLDAIGW